MSDPEWAKMQLPRRYHTGQIVFSNTSRGRVHSVADNTFSVVWDGGDGYAVVYPTEISMVRPAYPWEA